MCVCDGERVSTKDLLLVFKTKGGAACALTVNKHLFCSLKILMGTKSANKESYPVAAHAMCLLYNCAAIWFAGG